MTFYECLPSPATRWVISRVNLPKHQQTYWHGCVPESIQKRADELFELHTDWAGVVLKEKEFGGEEVEFIIPA